MAKIVFLTGAGLSANAGIPTYRGNEDSLWENMDFMSLASAYGFRINQEVALRFYNDRRALMESIQPTAAHLMISSLSESNDVTIITQNVDDLHEKAGSKVVHHFHGKLFQMCNERKTMFAPYTEDIIYGETLAPDGSQYRPAVVLFGEPIDEFVINQAYKAVREADYIVIIGTSLQVYPFASIPTLVKPNQHLFYIDPIDNEEILDGLHCKVTKYLVDADQGMENFLQFISNLEVLSERKQI